MFLIKNSNTEEDAVRIFVEFDKKKCECLSNLLISERCGGCEILFDPLERQKWLNIQNILLERVRVNPSKMLFGDENDDIDEALTPGFLKSEE